jgi:hypothetical protein
VDAIHEYLLLKGVEAVAIHGGKGQSGSCVGMDLLPRQPLAFLFPFPYPCLASLPVLSKFLPWL